MRIEFAV